MKNNKETIELTVEDVFLGQFAIAKFQKVDLPALISYRFLKLSKKILEEIKNFNDSRNKLIEKYGEKKEDGSVEIKDLSKVEDFKKEIEPILKEKIELEWTTLDISDLGDIKLTVEDIDSLIKLKIIK
jgi:hypothetical protein